MRRGQLSIHKYVHILIMENSGYHVTDRLIVKEPVNSTILEYFTLFALCNIHDWYRTIGPASALKKI